MSKNLRDEFDSLRSDFDKLNDAFNGFGKAFKTFESMYEHEMAINEAIMDTRNRFGCEIDCEERDY